MKLSDFEKTVTTILNTKEFLPSITIFTIKERHYTFKSFEVIPDTNIVVIPEINEEKHKIYIDVSTINYITTDYADNY